MRRALNKVDESGVEDGGEVFLLLLMRRYLLWETILREKRFTSSANRKICAVLE